MISLKKLFWRVVSVHLILILFFSVIFTREVLAEIQLTGKDYAELSQFIFMHECSGKPENLVVWNEGEEFPSLGVGHFIWYGGSASSRPFTEKFPELLAYLETKGRKVPAWIKELPQGQAPWASREEFIADRQGPRVASLRSLMTRTIGLQTRFIAKRVQGLLPSLLAAAPEASREGLRVKFEALGSTKEGLFAIIDYTQFKGEGLSGTERYGEQGWGLLQVLQEMRPSPAGDARAMLQEFVRAAQVVLERRVNLAPAERNEARWLVGWKNRVRSYLSE